MFASVLGAPRNAEKYPTVKVIPVYVTPDAKTLQFMAEAVRDGKLVIPIGRKLPLSKAAEASSRRREGWYQEGLCWWLDIILRTEDARERKIGNEKGSARNQPRFETEWRWVCRMPGVTEGLVVSSPSVCGVVAASDAVTVLRVSMRQSMRRRQGIRS